MSDKERIRELEEEVKRLTIELDMADGCLDMIRDFLERHDPEFTPEKRGETPAMFYEEWIMAVWQKRNKELIERLESAETALRRASRKGVSDWKPPTIRTWF